MNMIRSSVEALIFDDDKNLKINIQFFVKKKQFKVFITLSQPKVAIQFFEAVFKLKNLTIIDPTDPEKEVCQREMRAYLVKTEAEF